MEEHGSNKKSAVGTYIKNESTCDMLGIARIYLKEGVVHINPINQIPPLTCKFFNDADSLYIINGALVVGLDGITADVLNAMPSHSFVMDFKKGLIGRKDLKGFIFVPKEFLQLLTDTNGISLMFKPLSNSGAHECYMACRNDEKEMRDCNKFTVYVEGKFGNSTVERRFLQPCSIPMLKELCISYVFHENLPTNKLSERLKSKLQQLNELNRKLTDEVAAFESLDSNTEKIDQLEGKLHQLEIKTP